MKKKDRKEYQKKWYEENKEAASEQQKKYYEEHKEIILEQHKKRYEENKEALLERQKRYYEENKEAISERRKGWYEKNPVSATIISLYRTAKNRAKAKGLPFTLTKEWVVERIEWGKCELSGIPFNLEVGRGVSGPFSPSIDKIVPELGYTPENSRMILCGINSLKSTGTDEEMWKIINAMIDYKGR